MSLMARGALVTVLLAFPRVALADPGPLVPRAASTHACTAPAQVPSGTTTLPNDCAYAGTFFVLSSNTTLDCNGAQLTAGKGIIVKGAIENVTIENCWLSGTDGIAVAPPDRLPNESEDAWRLRSPKNVVLSHVSLTASKSSGVFLGPALDGVVLEDSIVDGSESAGVYVEHGTEHAKIRRNLIRNNGFRDGGIDRTEWSRREGIAVDAAAQNEIEDNVLEGNAFGGVFLYKNCREHVSTDPSSPPRPLHAASNVIRRNTFRNMPFGVWIAARQARDLGAWDCGDPTAYAPMNPIPLAKAFPPGYPTSKGTYPASYTNNPEYFYDAVQGKPCKGGCVSTRDAIWAWEDYAEDNTVEENRFENLGLAGVRVEDDRATIAGNAFVGDFDFVYVGTPLRSRFLGHPVRGTVLRQNHFSPLDSRVTFEEHVALVPGEHEGTVLEGNCAEPCPVALPDAGASAPAAPAPPAGSAAPASAPTSTTPAEATASGCATSASRDATAPALVAGVAALLASLLARRRRVSGIAHHQRPR